MAESLLSVSCASADAGAAALAVLEDAADAGVVRIEDAAVVVRGESGHVEIRQTRQLAAGEGVVAGGAIGVILGIVLGGPIAGAAVGMAGGGAWSVRDTGIADDELARLGKRLETGAALLLALVDDVDRPQLVARLEPYGVVSVALGEP